MNKFLLYIISLIVVMNLSAQSIEKRTLTDTLQIDEVVVTASRPTLITKNNKLIFDVEHSPLNTPAFNALDLLQRTPLLQADNDGNISYNNTPVTVFVNGRKTDLTSTDLAAYLKSYNATDIKSIEIRPVSSAQYDASINGAIINIVTRSLSVGYNANLSAGLIYSKHDNINNNENISFNLGSEKYNLYGSYGYNYNRSEGGKSYSMQELQDQGLIYRTELLDNIDKSHTHSYITGFTVQPSKRHRFGGEFYGNNYRLPLSTYTYDYHVLYGNIHKANALLSNNSDRKIALYKYSGYYVWSIDSLGSALTLYTGGLRQNNSSSRLSETDYLTGTYYDNKESDLSDAKTDMQFYQGDFTKEFKSGFSVTGGLKYTDTHRKSSYCTDVFELSDSQWEEIVGRFAFEYKERIAAAYISAESPIFKHGYISAGLRMEHTDLAGNNSQNNETRQKYIGWFPSLSYSHKIKQIHTIAFSANRSIIRPPFAVINNYSNKISEHFYDVGNPDLKPAYRNTVSLRYNYSRHMLSATLNIYEDMFSTVSQPQENGDIYNITTNGKKNQRYFILTYGYNGNITPFWKLDGFMSGRWIYIPENIRYRNIFTAALYAINRFQINKNITMELNGSYTSPTTQINMYIGHNLSFDFNYIHSLLNNRLNIKFSIYDLLNTKKNVSDQYSSGFYKHYYYKGITQKVGLSISYNLGSKKQHKELRKENVTGYENRL